MHDPSHTPPAPAPARRRLALVASLALLAAVSLVAGASAQLNVPQATEVDTAKTPGAHETLAWIRIGGAEYGSDKLPAGSWTPMEAEFHSVAFESDTHGFAAGSQCKTAAGGLTGEELSAYLASCPRAPVIYEYVKDEAEARWRMIMPPDGDGYVGAVAFMRDGSALAVGGTGKYPAREQVGDDVAGDGRAWLYKDGFWFEVDEANMQPGMRGMTAVAMSPRVGACVDAEGAADRVQCGLAGAYQQLWLWKDGRFVKGWGTTDAAPAPTGTIDDPASFRFRVRSIAFPGQEIADSAAPGAPDDPPRATQAIAFTSGCCDASGPVTNTPRALVFDGDAVHVKELAAAGGVDPPPEAGPAPGDAISKRDVPDSIYDMAVTGSGANATVVASPGGAPGGVSGSEPESASRVLTFSVPPPSGSIASNLSPAGVVPEISTVRLLGAAGDGGTSVDWAVGTLTDTGQAVAYSPPVDNALADARQITVLSCGDGDWKPDDILNVIGSQSTNGAPDLRCRPYDQEGYTGQTDSDHLFALPTYQLNDFTFTDETKSVGWAVGARGALVRFGGVGTVTGSAGDDAPPKLGAATLVRFSGSDVYDAFRPLPGDGRTAPVPSLVSNGTEQLDKPDFVPGGSPNPATPSDPNYPSEDVASMVMSRDGGEGWAVGAHSAEFVDASQPVVAPLPTLYHYDGVRWSRCDITGLPGMLPADPACASLAGLIDGGAAGSRHVLLRYAARVPLENDDDPSNDDEFEVVAVGTPYDPSPTDGSTGEVLVRYRDGRWTVDEAWRAARPASIGPGIAIAYTAPDDGWVLTGESDSLIVHHWDGERWMNCKDGDARTNACGDPDQILPLENAASTGALVTAGERIYLAGNRNAAGAVGGAGSFPAIIYKDPEGDWTSDYDPGCPPRDGPGCGDGADQTAQGQVKNFVVTPDGQGWAVGSFSNSLGAGLEAAPESVREAAPEGSFDPPVYLLRRDGRTWRPYTEDDASAEYLPIAERPTPVILDPETGVAAIHTQGQAANGPGVLIFDPDRGEAGRWRALETPFHGRTGSEAAMGGLMRFFAPDGRGGAWLAARQRNSGGSGVRESVHFWHYTDEAPKPVFEEAPHPVRETITGGAAGADGSFWVTTNSAFVYRYDRLTGWDKLRMPGWDPGRVVTKTSEANAVAVGPDGKGLIVGKDGRIGQLSALGITLDPAAGKTCGSPPCGTGRDLRAVAIAPDGAAMAGGDASTLIYRPPGGEFRRVDFGGSDKATITDVSMPTSDRAWLVNTLGQVYAGTREGDKWTFDVENRGAGGRLLSFDERGSLLKLRAIEIDKDGEGYAVGERGLILERRGDGGWQRLKTSFLDTFRSIALAPNGRDSGALVGGDMGLILTLEDGEFRAAREADLFDPLNWGAGSSRAASVLGVAIVPGIEDGETEAWAVQQPLGGRAGAVLHYTSNADQPLLRTSRRLEPLPDTPAPREGEISFAAFGRSECHGLGPKCPEGHARGLFHEAVSRRVTREVIKRSEEPGGPEFVVFTGDVGRAAGTEEGSGTNTPLDKSWVHRRWRELVADRLVAAGVPIFGAVGANDLDRTSACTSPGTCPADSEGQGTGAGLNWGWRKAMADMQAPWGSEDEADSGAFHFDPVPSTGTDDPAVGQARTHYAVDICGAGGCPARLIVLDNSLRTLASSDPSQNPLEPGGGQLTWLEDTLAGMREGQQAIVAMNTPTYSYQAGDPTSWAGDMFQLETVLMQHDVKMVVSGRLGWNGRYWVTSPGLHAPCPGDDYREDSNAPKPEEPPCSEQTSAATDPAQEAADQLADALQGAGAPAPPPGAPVGAPDTGIQGLIPWVVAASAGGQFGPDGTQGGAAGDGWWHGYSIVRMDKSGDPTKTIVEQRPVFDWISITAATHILKPRQRVILRGEGREPVGMDVPARFDAINSPAITHRYDLLLADESNPSLPKRDADGEYVFLPESVGRVDKQSGVVTAGPGRQERTYAVAVLSVGDKVASWPLVFEPGKGFKPRPVAEPAVVRPPAPLPPVRPPAPPAVVLNQPPAPTPPPTPPAPLPTINVPTLHLPPPPTLPQLPATPAGTPTPAPPPPVAPPAPPGSSGGLPLSLNAPVSPISIVTTVIPPSPPPVNPAPPGGSAARKEARQRQAATAKSEEGGRDASAQEGQSGGDSGSSAMTRRDQTRPAPSYGSYRDDKRYSFTAVSRQEQVSAWSRGALYGGMTIAAALVLALGWGTVRPTPKRRQRPQPAPETVRTYVRRRHD